ncbi:hypothetical protein PQI66_08045 [Corynebacterium sp. USCH3]|uniref:hypothetical protein n=1 Tax=Corynebacterium sp. USCH3 TaxID=3024840 RepID=UPI00309F161E
MLNTTSRRLIAAAVAAVTATSLAACSDDEDDAQPASTPAEDSSQTTETETEDAQEGVAEHTFTVTDEISVADAGKVRGLEMAADGSLTAMVSSIEQGTPARVVSIDTGNGETRDVAEVSPEQWNYVDAGVRSDPETTSLVAPLTHLLDDEGNRTDEVLTASLDGNPVQVNLDTGEVTVGSNGPGGSPHLGFADMGDYLLTSMNGGGLLSLGNDGPDGLSGYAAEMGPSGTDSEVMVRVERQRVYTTEIDAVDDSTAIAVIAQDSVEDAGGAQLVTVDLTAEPRSDEGNVTDTYSVEGLPGGAQITGVALDPEDENVAWISVNGEDTLYKVELES